MQFFRRKAATVTNLRSVLTDEEEKPREELWIDMLKPRTKVMTQKKLEKKLSKSRTFTSKSALSLDERKYFLEFLNEKLETAEARLQDMDKRLKVMMTR